MKLKLEDLKKLHNEDKLLGQLDVDNEAYHAGPGISSTNLVDLSEYSLAHMKYWKENPIEPSKAMKDGSLIHMAVLEPDLLNEHYKVVPTVDKRTKEGRAIWDKITSEGKEPITQDTMDKVNAVRQSLLSTNIGKQLFTGITAEQAFYWRDPDTDVLCKVKADAINFNLKILIDLKKTSDGRLFNIRNSIKNYGYRLQASYYLDGINQALKTKALDGAVWAFVEDSAPYGVRFIEVKQSYLDEGFNLYKEALIKYAQAMKTGEFNSYPDQILVLED